MNNSDQLSHDRLLQEMFMWVHNKYPQTRGLYFHVENEFKPFPNESQQSIMIRKNRRKAIGTVPGVLDHLFYWKGRLYAFDAKIGKDRLSEDQLAFIDKCRQNGGDGWEVRDLDSFKKILANILESEKVSHDFIIH